MEETINQIQNNYNILATRTPTNSSIKPNEIDFSNIEDDNKLINFNLIFEDEETTPEHFIHKLYEQFLILCNCDIFFNNQAKFLPDSLKNRCKFDSLFKNCVILELFEVWIKTLTTLNSFKLNNITFQLVNNKEIKCQQQQ